MTIEAIRIDPATETVEVVTWDEAGGPFHEWVHGHTHGYFCSAGRLSHGKQTVYGFVNDEGMLKDLNEEPEFRHYFMWPGYRGALCGPACLVAHTPSGEETSLKDAEKLVEELRGKVRFAHPR